MSVNAALEEIHEAFFKISYISGCSKTFLKLCSNKKCK